MQNSCLKTKSQVKTYSLPPPPPSVTVPKFKRERCGGEKCSWEEFWNLDSKDKLAEAIIPWQLLFCRNHKMVALASQTADGFSFKMSDAKKNQKKIKMTVVKFESRPLVLATQISNPKILFQFNQLQYRRRERKFLVFLTQLASLKFNPSSCVAAQQLLNVNSTEKGN